MPDGSAAGMRTFAGESGVALSPLTFGSMRLDHAGDARQAAGLVQEALELGVTTFHVSAEYATWPLFVAAWNEVSASLRADAQVIAKVGVPHFGESRFDPTAFRNKVDGFRAALGRDRLDVVQWLLRYDLQDEAGRLAIFDRDANLVADVVEDLRANGVIGGLVSFPYTRPVAQRALAAPWCEGLALYCNPLELEMVDLFDSAAEARKSVVAIRPLAAGRLFMETTFTTAEAIQLPLSHPAVATVVASVSTSARLREAAAAARASEPPPGSWRETLSSARKSLDV